MKDCDCLKKIDKAIDWFRQDHDWKASSNRDVEGRIVDIIQLIIMEAMKKNE